LIGHCPEGKIPSLSPSNQTFWRVFMMILPGLMRKDGYDYSAMQVVFNNCGFSRHRRELYQEKCIAVIDVIHKKRTKTENGCNEKKRQECELMFGKEHMQWACKNCKEIKNGQCTQNKSD
jgi:hypothetical protein